MYIIRANGPIGRKGLAARLDLGEGSSRGLISHIEELGLVTQMEEGLKLSKRGTRYLNDIGFRTLALVVHDLTVDEHDFAIRLSGMAGLIKDGIRERDEAMMAGASGATTLLFRGKKLMLPDHFDLDKKMPKIARAFRENFELEDGDAVLIGTGDSEARAEDGAFAAASGLLMLRQEELETTGK
ncbi:MAG: hypothetical protein KAS67_00455 [Thermoplasmata archaeon]|nr:hypothetical protein [Thermoplasmata archaeon]